MAMERKRVSGRFVTENPESANAKLTVRVTPSLRKEVESIAGSDVAAWLRQAIIEKLNREQFDNA